MASLITARRIPFYNRPGTFKDLGKRFPNRTQLVADLIEFPILQGLRAEFFFTGEK